MSRLLLPVGFALCLSAVLVMPAPPVVAAAPPTKPDEKLVEQVRRAIDNGVRYLKSKQTPQGNWEGIVIDFLAGMEGGSTALVTLALLNCGESPDDPKIARALKYLETLEPKKTYVVGLCNLVFAETHDKKYLPIIQKNAQWLIDNANGWRKGRQKLEGWSYPLDQGADNSNTQYALLGLYAAKQAGAKIENKVWEGILEYYTSAQKPQPGNDLAAGWAYHNDKFESPSISMTVAGVCGLLIASMGLDQSEQQLDPATGIAKSCGKYSENTAVAKGMHWVADHFTFSSSKSTFYNIYGMERLGRLSGQRFIGTHDWYREGCSMLVKMQDTDGSFSQGKNIDGYALLATSFSLLFLSKGRTPVLISKFAWGDLKEKGNGGFIEVPPLGGPIPPEGGANWNRKHNDTRHIVDFCSKELFNGAPLSWQVYDARRQAFNNDGDGGRTGKEKILDEVGLLLQSPILYLNGHGAIRLTPAQEEILKTYVEEGGFLVAEACCGDPEFTQSFKKLMKRLFPDNRFTPMPPEHAILRILPGVLPTDFPDVEVMERGCRTAAVFSPTPLAGYWEEAKYMPKDSRRPQNRGEKAFCLARNIIAYATGFEMPKPKLSFTKVERMPPDSATRGKFKALLLDVNGDSDKPAPESFRNVMGYLRDNARIDVSASSAVMEPANEDIAGFKFMFLHGRKPLKWEQGEIESVLSNLQTGGTLFADAACGGYAQWKAFDESFRKMCAQLYPDRKLVVIPRSEDGKEDPLFKIAGEAGINLNSLRCRRELANGQGPDPEMRPYPVLLEGIKIDGRWVVIYSKYDVGCAIQGHKSADCLGYDKESAIKIAAAVALYSLKR